VDYWLGGEPPIEEGLVDTDAWALKENKISITPISYDLTCREEIGRLQGFPMPTFRQLRK
jgi:broad specificity polyphosphatase/5'/3'-nucleotidase SurE